MVNSGFDASVLAAKGRREIEREVGPEAEASLES